MDWRDDLEQRYVGEKSISISGVTGGSQQLTILEAQVSLTGPEAPCIHCIDYLRSGYFKDSKGHCWAFGIAAVETEEIRQLNTLPGLSDDPSAVGLLRVEEEQIIHELEGQGVVSKARSPFNRPIWPVRKSSGEWRLMVDYHGLNEVMPPLSTAVPDMLELQYKLESKGWKYSPTICHGLIQAALEKGEAPDHLQYINDIIVWGNTAEEVFEKGEIIQILLKAGFAIKQSKVKGPAKEIQFLGLKWQDGCRQILKEEAQLAQTLPLKFAVHNIQPGDWVLVKEWKEAPLVAKWRGPFQVLLTTETAVKTTEHRWTHNTQVKVSKAPEIWASQLEKDGTPQMTLRRNGPEQQPLIQHVTKGMQVVAMPTDPEMATKGQRIMSLQIIAKPKKTQEEEIKSMAIKSVVKTIVKQVVPLQPMEIHGVAEIHLQLMEEPHDGAGGCLEEAVALSETCGERGLAPMLEQPVFEGLNPMEE
ncbi:hypothetical protein HGM15179_018114 [Zosterops borbonicus]|uniref:Murine leukemia virus integrase C-terminal domain-containing protein n=1 Tax=Zosterops borbonicus TaxID=364589 RepID=A0A8K1LCK6_9PASS|nr:hypothetical protein HGM15179_018114 [Zosterops borbonicus]